MHTAFVKSIPEPGSVFELEKRESDHLFKTLRCRVGEKLRLCDGKGTVAEAEAAPDIFENYQSTQVATDLSSEADRHRAEVIQQMRAAIAANNPIKSEPKSSEPVGPQFNAANLTQTTPTKPVVSDSKATNASQIPPSQLPGNPAAETAPKQTSEKPKPIPEDTRSRLIELSKNKDFTVATIAKEANRRPNKHQAAKDEVYISLH